MKNADTRKNIHASFRDLSGFLFLKDNVLYRQINNSYRDDYELLMGSGLYGELVGQGLLISHKEAAADGRVAPNAYKIIQPEPVTFVSYPYEWCFSQLKAAALATLDIQEAALQYGMSLKDASAYNVQFMNCRPVLIDTLSFEKYEEGRPWIAYRQFCQHFLAPLLLMSYKDVRLAQLLRIYIDGIPLDLASSLLPFRTFFRFSCLSHIHLHARCQTHFADKDVEKGKGKIGKAAFAALINNLKSVVSRLSWDPGRTEWSDYYDDNKSSVIERKKKAVSDFLDAIRPETVWDLGSNTGLFSRIASERGARVISFDADPLCVEKNYLECVKRGQKNILPLLMDLVNPSPAIGWENRERASLAERGPADAVLALALIHHLAISNNLPLERIAEFFHKICRSLVIEFVPKHDPRAHRLLSGREDIFPGYSKEGFEEGFAKYFTIQRSADIEGSGRVLYLMSKR